MKKRKRHSFYPNNHNFPQWRSNGSVMPSGIYEGNSIRQIILTLPDYIFRSLTQYSNTLITSEMIKDIATFDNKPWNTLCRCGNPADCYECHHQNSKPTFWCNSCHPPGINNTNSKFRTGYGYMDISTMFTGSPSLVRRLERELVRHLIKAKGYQGNRSFRKSNAYF
jgi:hypothetical protein